MRTKISYRINSELAEVVRAVSAQCGLSMDEYCKRAMILITQQGLDEGRLHGAGNNTTGSNSEGDTGSVGLSRSSDTAALSDTSDAGSNSKE